LTKIILEFIKSYVVYLVSLLGHLVPIYNHLEYSLGMRTGDLKLRMTFSTSRFTGEFGNWLACGRRFFVLVIRMYLRSTSAKVEARRHCNMMAQLSIHTQLVLASKR
jgi:hypothetical protein